MRMVLKRPVVKVRLMVGGQDMSRLSEGVGGFGQFAVNSSVRTALHLSEAFWAIQHVESAATRW